MTLSFRTLSNTLLLLSALCTLPSLTEAANAKRGMAFALDLTEAGDASKASGTQISWEYDWQLNAPPNLPAGIEHVPMQHDRNGIDGFEAAVKGMGAKVALVGLHLLIIHPFSLYSYIVFYHLGLQ